MPKPLFITKHGKLGRKGNTLYFSGEDMEKIVPIAQVSQIHCMGSVTLTSGAVDLVSVKGIPVHFYTVDGRYKGSFLPRKAGNGKLKIAQVQHYLDSNKRKYIAQQIILGIKNSMLKSLRDSKIDTSALKEVEIAASSIEKLRGSEARLWSEYYRLFAKIIRMKFTRRTRRPPRDGVNAMISYGNVLLYGIMLSSIIKANLDPDISFLHEPMESRFSLTLDLSEPFKPLLVMRTVKRIINKGIIKRQDFVKSQKNEGVYLSSEGRRKFVKELNKTLSSTVYSSKLKRSVSYLSIMEYEAKRFSYHFTGRKKYKAFKPWW